MRILLSSTQFPGNGGAATNTYKLHKFFSKETNHSVYCIFFLANKEDATTIDFDPEKIGNIGFLYCCAINGQLQNFDCKTGTFSEYDSHFLKEFRQKITDILGGYPDIILAKNYRAPITTSFLFPTVQNIYYLVSGVYYLTLLNNNNSNNVSAQNLLENIKNYNLEQYKQNTNIKQEIQSLELAKRVIFNSELTCTLFQTFYKDKIKDFSIVNTSLFQNIVSLSKENLCSRTYDLFFICSDFNRKIKNCKFVKKLFQQKEFKSLKKLVIGHGSLFDTDIPNIVILPPQPNHLISSFMKQCKVLVFPSLFDSSPNTVYEALESGCNVVISKNIGNWRKFHVDSVCNDVYDEKEWILKIEKNLKQKVNHDIEFQSFDFT